MHGDRDPGPPARPLIGPALIVIELITLIQAALDVARWAGGVHPAEPATHVGYLLTSVAVLPLAAGSVRREESRWAVATLAIGCLLVAILSIRLHQTAEQLVPGATSAS